MKQIQQEVDPRLTEIEVNTEKQDSDVINEDEKTLLRETRSPHQEEETHGMTLQCLDKRGESVCVIAFAQSPILF